MVGLDATPSSAHLPRILKRDNAQMQRNIPNGFKAPNKLSGLAENEPILVGLSGGADSSALLFMLSLYSKESGAKIFAAHLNHGIRGEEADRDENFCREFAKSLNVEFFSKKLDIPAIALQTGESVETAARNERYAFFDSIMELHGIKILATAHNADDNFETLLFNLARGTGLCGLCGIPESRPAKNGVVIRPILSMEKSEIFEFCKANGINFVTDSTNLVNDYTRNKIRNQVIPILKEINSAAIKNASKTARSLKEDSAYLQEATDRFIKEFCNDHSIDAKALCSAPTSIANRALIRLYDEVSNGGTLETVHINAIKELASKSVAHSSISLPCETDAVIEGGKLCFVKRKITEDFFEYEKKLTDGENEIQEAKITVFVNSEQYLKNIYKNSILLHITFDKIDGTLIARNRRQGDKILLGGMHKSVKKLMNEKKIPLELRQRIPVICDDKGILAIPYIGIRDGAAHKSNDKTTNFIKINVCIH